MTPQFYGISHVLTQPCDIVLWRVWLTMFLRLVGSEFEEFGILLSHHCFQSAFGAYENATASL
jgi:hypothetical protein